MATAIRVRVSTNRGGDTQRGGAPPIPSLWVAGDLAVRWRFGPLTPVTWEAGAVGVRWRFGPVGTTPPVL